jgi:hypothetical protein
MRQRSSNENLDRQWLRVVARAFVEMDVRVTHKDMARRAYDLFVARGREHGRDLEDWLQAERELQLGTDTNGFVDLL